MPQIAGSTVVITGAGSGIGRLTAIDFARRGARLVLAGRREAPLRAVASACARAGGSAYAVPTDVADEAAVEALAASAERRFGPIDVWLNNAAVLLFARFHQAPPDVYRRVIETNLFGCIHGARAAIRRFREHGRGVLINMSSVVAYAPQPYTSAYVASNFAIRGLSDCIRMELILDGLDDIHVCTVLPASVDTPFFRHAANFTGRAPKASTPVNAPEAVSSAILRLVERPQREVIVGRGGRPLVWRSMLRPERHERSAARQVHDDHFEDAPAEPTDGNVFKGSSWTGVTGGWREHEQRRRGGLTWRLAAMGVALGVGAVAVAWKPSEDTRA